ncbi:MAG: DNA polymerase IV [Acidobacteriota bacterium]|nr:DNA polymerase IV [Acidobacteriota bacterium]
MRHIIHVDMDAFFASVEQLDNPELRGKPVIVGASPDARGVVSAASYEARRFGVKSAMPSSQARRLCPEGIFVPVRMGRYVEMSRQIMGIFEQYTPLVEPVSVDEAFLDVTGCERLFGPAPEIGRGIRERIARETGLSASVGVAPNKFLAKLASDHDKPGGLVIIEPEKVLEFLAPLPISRLWGVGKATEQRLRTLGIHTIGRLAEYPREMLVRQFGILGGQLNDLAHGIDDRPVVVQGEAKSVSNEHTYQVDTRDPDVMERTLLWLSDKVGARLREAGLRGRTVQLKVRFGDFTTITRRETLSNPTDANAVIYQTALGLLRAVPLESRKVRLLGVGVSGFDQPVQAALFDAPQETHSPLDDTLDEIRRKFGTDKIKRGRLVDDE